MFTVPTTISPALLAFCRSISSERPVYVWSKPSGEAGPHLCFDNVARKIGLDGGQIAFGWTIWHLPNLYFEAEHHGVWRNSQRNFLDVSPQLSRARKILFLPEPAAVYDPICFCSNIIEPAARGFLATEFVALARARNAAIDRYRNNGHITVRFTLADHMEMARLRQSLAELMRIARHPLG